MCYSRLAAEALQRGICAWKLRGELHDFAHCLQELREGGENPRRLDLFGAEDLVGKITSLGSKCHARSAATRAVQRRLALLKVRWLHRARRRLGVRSIFRN